MRLLKRYHEKYSRTERFYEKLMLNAEIKKGIKIRNGRIETYWKSAHRERWGIKVRRYLRVRKIGK